MSASIVGGRGRHRGTIEILAARTRGELLLAHSRTGAMMRTVPIVSRAVIRWRGAGRRGLVPVVSSSGTTVAARIVGT